MSAATGEEKPVRVWGLPLMPYTFAQALDQIDRLIRLGKPQYVITANVHYAMLAERDPSLAAINEGAAFLVADGMPLVWASRWQRRRLPERVTGADLVPALCALAADRQYRVFFLGGAPGVGEEAANQLRARHPQLQVVGIETPPFRPLTPDEHAGLIHRIRQAGPHILLVAFGQPKGEQWLATNLADLGRASVCAGGGGTGFRGRSRAPGAAADPAAGTGVGLPAVPRAGPAVASLPGQRMVRAAHAGAGPGYMGPH